VLLYQPPLSRTARERLGILRDSDDGFVIAEKDMALRGPGELLGTRQTGQVQFRIADLTRDAALMEGVHDAAETIAETAPAAVAPLIARWLGTAAMYAEA
jgi:ATP-dependent DNA helicase RecG